MTRLLMVGQYLQVPLQLQMMRLQGWLDGMLLADAAPPEEEKKGGLPTWAIIAIIAAVILCVIPICIILVLTLMGPAIGDVFSGVIEEME